MKRSEFYRRRKITCTVAPDGAWSCQIEGLAPITGLDPETTERLDEHAVYVEAILAARAEVDRALGRHPLGSLFPRLFGSKAGHKAKPTPPRRLHVDLSPLARSARVEGQ